MEVGGGAAYPAASVAFCVFSGIDIPVPIFDATAEDRGEVEKSLVKRLRRPIGMLCDS